MEICGLLANLSKEKSEAAGCASDKAATAATAVQDFFGNLEPLVAAHPDGKTRIDSIMRMLNELLQASKDAMSKQAADERKSAEVAAAAQSTGIGQEMQSRLAGSEEKRNAEQITLSPDELDEALQDPAAKARIDAALQAKKARLSLA